MLIFQTVLDPTIVALGSYRYGGLLWYWDHSDIGAYYGIGAKTALDHKDIMA